MRKGTDKSRVLASRIALSTVLILACGIPRVLAALYLPNEEGDPYPYMQAAESLRANIVAGTLSISNLFGFWLPLYQLVCGVLGGLLGNTLLLGKLLSAFCGVGVCLLTYVITLHLTESRALSVSAFALVALSPLHIIYSSFSMPDTPHTFLVMGGLYCVITRRWILAATFIALGSLTRVESWMFVLLLPSLQILCEHKITLTAFLIALSAPLFWLYICWVATGNPFAYFEIRRDYINDVLAANPGLAYFGLSHLWSNLRTLLYSVGPAVLLGCAAGAWLILRGFRLKSIASIAESSFGILTALVFFFSSIGFILLAFLTKHQVDLWPRYGLMLFALGTPILAWTYASVASTRPTSAEALSIIVAALCIGQLTVQLIGGERFLSQVNKKRLVANFLEQQYRATPNFKAFCDDHTIRSLTSIPAGRFLDSSNAPGDSTAFLAFLKSNQIEYVVYTRSESSAMLRLSEQLGDETFEKSFRLVLRTGSNLDYSAPRLYQTVGDSK